MTTNDWKEMITIFLFLITAFAGLWKAVDAIVGYFSQRREKSLRMQVEKLQKDIRELEAGIKRLEELTNQQAKNFSDISEKAASNREIIKMLKDDLDYLMRMLIDKNFKK